MNAFRISVLLGAGLLWTAAAAAQDTYSPAGCMSCQGREYRLVYQTQYEQRQTTSYRIEYETQYEERRETRYRPVWETEVRERRYTVSKPILETAEREERVTVMKPVCETQVRDESYDTVHYVQETAEREERVIVNQPVTETAEREECYTVQRPVVETVYRPQCRTVMQPVVTQQTQFVDQGCYQDQVTYKPSWWQHQLAWQSGGCAVDPVTGQVVYQRPGFYWAPVNRGTYEVARVWQPNVVAQQVQQVQYVPQTVTEQVPVQVTRYQSEQVVRKVPYQTCRIVQQEVVRKIPYTVSRPVVERVERKVPVQVYRMVTEEQVRKVPYQTCRMVQEERVEQVPTQVCRMEAYEETVRIPHVVEKRIPVTCNYTVPHVECYRVPVDDCCCGPQLRRAVEFELLRRSGRQRRGHDRAGRQRHDVRPDPDAGPDDFEAGHFQPVERREAAGIAPATDAHAPGGCRATVRRRKTAARGRSRGSANRMPPRLRRSIRRLGRWPMVPVLRPSSGDVEKPPCHTIPIP